MAIDILIVGAGLARDWIDYFVSRDKPAPTIAFLPGIDHVLPLNRWFIIKPRSLQISIRFT